MLYWFLSDEQQVRRLRISHIKFSHNVPKRGKSSRVKFATLWTFGEIHNKLDSIILKVLELVLRHLTTKEAINGRQMCILVDLAVLSVPHDVILDQVTDLNVGRLGKHMCERIQSV